MEVEAAVQNGYRLLKVHEIVGYRKSLPLFQDFYTRLAKRKISSEGFEGEDLTQEQKESQVKKINDRMPGLNLTVGECRFNLARRNFSKGSRHECTLQHAGQLSSSLYFQK